MKEIQEKIGINNQAVLRADIRVPDNAAGLVIFSHGSGSSRLSTRNRHVANMMNNAGIATFLTDLLTVQEDNEDVNRFDIDLLANRLISVTNYAYKHPALADLPIGYFGASTGAASALRAAARIPGIIKAVVSRGGRPDLAGTDLPNVKAPTLLIVGSLDQDVLLLNKDAYSKLKCSKDLQVIAGATHLFEEPGCLDEVADLAITWFSKFLVLNEYPVK